MRILHTADWHMNDRLGRVERREDICRSLEQIARYLEEHCVDLMIVAGDVFERSHQDELRKAVQDIKHIFSPFLTRGGTIVAISGNHDSDIFFTTLRDALDLVMPGRSGVNDSQATGRLYIAPNARLLRLADTGGNLVQFALMPYPTARCYPLGEQAEYRSIEEKHQAIQRSFIRHLQALMSPERGFDQRLPSVLVSHVHVRGVRAHNLFRLTETEDVIFDPSDIPAHWAYIAYGHIHQPQPAVAGADHIRYAGSIERLDFGERQDDKSVVLLDIGPTGLVGTPVLLPLPSTPIYHIEITDPVAQLPQLAAQDPDAERALVKYTLHWQPGVHNSREILCQAIHDIFPRWYEREVRQIGIDAPRRGGPAPQQLQNVAGTVRTYLQAQLSTHTQRSHLLALAEQLLAEEDYQ